MFQRAGTAAKAFCALDPRKKNFIVALPRSRIASKWPFQESRSLLSEMKSLLNALPDSTSVDLFSVGIDAFTTDLPSLGWAYNAWIRLELWLVFVVPGRFPGSLSAFPQAKNGIRYGRFKLKDVVEAINGDSTDERYVELVQIIKRIRGAKEE
jgi:hypothetical protein